MTENTAQYITDAEAEALALRDRAAEEGLVGSVLINPDVFHRQKKVVSPFDFAIHRLGYIWRAFEILDEQATAIDLVTLQGVFIDHPELSDGNDPAAITALINQCPTSLHADDYAKRIKGFSLRRSLLKRLNIQAEVLFDKSKTTNETLEQFSEIAKEEVYQGGRDTSVDAIEVSVDLMVSIHDDRPKAVPVYRVWSEIDEKGATTVKSHGIQSIQRLFGGHPLGALSFLVGDSSIGKTALALEYAEIASYFGEMTIYNALDSMSRNLVARRTNPAAGLTAIKMRIGKNFPGGYNDADIAKVDAEIIAYQTAHAAGKLRFDKARTIADVERSLQKHRPRFYIVDDLTSMKSRETKKTLKLLGLAEELKALALEYEVAILTLHHLPREAALRLWNPHEVTEKDGYPEMTDLGWATDMRYVIDILEFVVPDRKALIDDEEMLIHLWQMKDKESSRGAYAEYYFNRVDQRCRDHATVATKANPMKQSIFP